jgi:DNA invertase Pin-like site-specific DNA recombinase
MQDRIKSRTEQEVQIRTGREVPELVREMYLDRRYSDQEIADAIGVHRVTVTNWRQEWGIRREDRPAPEAAAS